jgi:predicted HicB family RNase H-like nuclease
MDENKTKDLLPEEFDSIEEAAEFWDSHSLADYWHETKEVQIDVRATRKQRVALASELAKQVADVAKREGVSVETLVNLWVAERLQTI